MNYQDMNEEEQVSANQEIYYRLSALKDILRGLAVSLSKYLILANSGGILATLTYLQSLTNTAPSTYIKTSITLFVIGLILISVALFWVYYRAWDIDNKYRQEMSRFYTNDISIIELRRRDNERTKSDKVEYVLAVLSFLSFVVAIISGAVNFL